MVGNLIMIFNTRDSICSNLRKLVAASRIGRARSSKKETCVVTADFWPGRS